MEAYTNGHGAAFYTNLFIPVLITVPVLGVGAASEVCVVDVDGDTHQQYCSDGCCGSVENKDRKCCTQKGGISTWAIVTIIVCSLFGISIVCTILYCYHKKSKKREHTHQSTDSVFSRASGRAVRSGRRRRVTCIPVMEPAQFGAGSQCPTVLPPDYHVAGNYPPGPGSVHPPSYSSLGPVPHTSTVPIGDLQTAYPGRLGAGGAPLYPLIPTAPPYEGSPPPYDLDPTQPTHHHQHSRVVHGQGHISQGTDLPGVD